MPVSTARPGQTNDPETRTVAHLRVRLVVHDALEKPRSVGADSLGPVHHPGGSPLQMRLVGTRTVFGNSDGVPVTSRTQVGSHALTFMEQLY